MLYSIRYEDETHKLIKVDKQVLLHPFSLDDEIVIEGKHYLVVGYELDYNRSIQRVVVREMEVTTSI